jgi:hypothetical protein
MITIQLPAGNAVSAAPSLTSLERRRAKTVGLISPSGRNAMSRLNDLPGRALELATQVGETIRDRVPDTAIKWVETGAALGALRTGTRVATTFVRRNPVIAVAAAAGAGLLWYAARRRAQQAQDGPIEGSATRIEAKRDNGSGTRTRKTRTGKRPSARSSTTS